MRLYFDTAELVDDTRRSSLVHVKSAVLRLHWTGNTAASPRSKQLIIIIFACLEINAKTNW